MNKKYFLKNKDNKVSLVCMDIPLKDYCKKRKLKKESFIEFKKKDYENYFFEAYEVKENKVVANLDKCKEIKIEKLRIKRNEKLNKLDIDFIRALEVDNKGLCKSIVELKKELREMPGNVRGKEFKDLEELKNHIPDCLK